MSEEKIYGPNLKKTVRKISRSFKKKKNEKSSAEKIVGKVKYHKSFHSNFLDNDRDIIVWLPPGYDKNSEERYPVLYMHDGQNIMDPSTSFAGVDWRIDETATRLIESGKMKELIIIGINNNSDRLEEYSDSEKGHNYLKFLSVELKSFIDSSYRTLTDRDNTAIMGSSMGGLNSLLAVWYHPDIFSKAGCLSSSFHFEKEKAIKMIEDFEGEIPKIKIYIDSGEDGKNEAQKMFCALSKKGFIIGENLDYFYASGAQHNESAWANRLERPLLFLFGK